MAHEKMTPLNAILNVSAILQTTVENDISAKKYGDPYKSPANEEDSDPQQQLPILRFKIIEDHKKLYEFVRVIWSSAQILMLTITSQISHIKLIMDQLVCNFTPLQEPLKDLLLNFFPPFYHPLKFKNILVEVVEGNAIPEWVCTDWILYKEILYHILQNAIKFNKQNGSIRIVVSFHTF